MQNQRSPRVCHYIEQYTTKLIWSDSDHTLQKHPTLPFSKAGLPGRPLSFPSGLSPALKALSHTKILAKASQHSFTPECPAAMVDRNHYYHLCQSGQCSLVQNYAQTDAIECRDTLCAVNLSQSRKKNWISRVLGNCNRNLNRGKPSVPALTSSNLL